MIELYADLLSQSHAYEYKDSLQKFLNERNLNGISWMHDIYLNRYGEASIKLRHLARNQSRVNRNKVKSFINDKVIRLNGVIIYIFFSFLFFLLFYFAFLDLSKYEQTIFFG